MKRSNPNIQYSTSTCATSRIALHVERNEVPDVATASGRSPVCANNTKRSVNELNGGVGNGIIVGDVPAGNLLAWPKLVLLAYERFAQPSFSSKRSRLRCQTHDMYGHCEPCRVVYVDRGPAGTERCEDVAQSFAGLSASQIRKPPISGTAWMRKMVWSRKNILGFRLLRMCVDTPTSVCVHLQFATLAQSTVMVTAHHFPSIRKGGRFAIRTPTCVCCRRRESSWRRCHTLGGEGQRGE